MAAFKEPGTCGRVVGVPLVGSALDLPRQTGHISGQESPGADLGGFVCVLGVEFNIKLGQILGLIWPNLIFNSSPNPPPPNFELRGQPVDS